MLQFWKTHVFAVALVAAVALCAPNQAFASGSTSTAERLVENGDQIARSYLEDAPVKSHPTGTPPCGNVCQRLEEAATAPLSKNASQQEIQRRLRREIWKQRVKRNLERGLEIWPHVRLAAKAFDTGWQIGTALRPLFYGFEMPSAPQSDRYVFTHAEPVLKGERLVMSSHVQGGRAEIFAPEDGWEISTGRVITWTEGPCTGGAPTFDMGQFSSGVVATQLLKAKYTYAATCDPDGDGPEQPKPIEREKWIAAVFMPHAPLPPHLYDREADQALNPDQSPGTRLLPQPKPFEEFRDELIADLIDAGEDEEILSEWTDSQLPDTDTADPTDSDAIDEALADALADKNDQLNPQTALDEDDAEAIARQCRALVDAMLRVGADECKALPIFVTGVDSQDAAAHDLYAIMNKQSPAILTREKKVGVQRDWYRNRPECTSGPHPDSTPGTHGHDYSCDEYPFFSTTEGGPFALFASLRTINFDHNKRQGDALGGFGSGWYPSYSPGFYRDCGVNPQPAEQPSEGEPILGDAFIAVPLPEPSTTVTGWLCNGRPGPGEELPEEDA